MRAKQILEAILPMTTSAGSAVAKAMAKWVWVRWGDASNYEKYDSVSETESDFADHLRKGSRVRRWVRYGVQVVPGYDGYNYISIFWGDDDANAARELTSEEKSQIERIVEQTPGFD
jgi:hypothetical protein